MSLTQEKIKKRKPALTRRRQLNLKLVTTVNGLMMLSSLC